MTQAELAEAAATSQSAIAAYESGAKVPSVRTLRRLADAVGLEIEMRVVPSLTREDRRSAFLHRLIAERLRDEPDATIRKARSNLERMIALHPQAKPLLDQWTMLLEQPVDVIADALTDLRPLYRELRQVAPFAGVLAPRERAWAYRQFRSEERRGL